MYEIKNGDYALDERKLPVELTESGRLLQRAKFALQCRKGTFPYNPTFGSRFHEVQIKSKENAQALCNELIMEALLGIPEVSGKSKSIVQNKNGEIESITLDLSTKNRKEEVHFTWD